MLEYFYPTYNIDLTYNTIENKYGDHNWIELNLNSIDSVNNFINNTPDKYYSMVLILSMTTPGDFFEISNDDLKNFYGGYLVNNMILGKALLNKISDDGKIVYVSSVAGNKPNPSINYSTLKGALQSFYLSLSTQSLYNQVIMVIVPGLIYETPAFYRHDSIMYNNDISNLTTKKEIAEFIITSDMSHNGKLVKFGKDW